MTASTFRDQAREVLLAYADWGDERLVDETLDRLEALAPRGWDAMLRELAETYPESIFPLNHAAADDGNGPQVISLIRLLHAAESKLAAVEALCDEWAGLVNARLTPDFVSREVRAAMRGGS